jgi:hypothetical protein
MAPVCAGKVLPSDFIANERTEAGFAAVVKATAMADKAFVQSMLCRRLSGLTLASFWPLLAAWQNA